MSNQHLSKMGRQLNLYDIALKIKDNAIYTPIELMGMFEVSLRTLQRDLSDLRGSGLINLKYDNEEDKLVVNTSDKKRKNAAQQTPRRIRHLKRLYRLGTLVKKLSRTDARVLREYESGVSEFEEYVELSKEDPENFPPEDIDIMREYYIHEIELYDLKAEYYALFPDICERTRQRDFAEIRSAGFELYYSREFKSYIFVYDYEEDSDQDY